MALTAATVQAHFGAILSHMTGAAVSVTWGGTPYSGLRGQLTAEEQLSMRGALDAPEGAARFSAAAFTSGYPKAGDSITLTEGGTSTIYIVRSVAFDAMRATFRLVYGSRYAA